MQRLKLSREFISSFLKDAIPEYERMLTFIEGNGGWVSPPPKITEWLTNLNAHDYLNPLAMENHAARRLLTILRNDVFRKLDKQRDDKKLYG